MRRRERLAPAAAGARWRDHGIRRADGRDTDVSQIERLQTAFATSPCLETIGQFAGGIAPELNTPMQHLGDNVQFLDRAFRDLQRVLERGVAGSPDVGLAFLLHEIPKAL